MVSSLSSLNNVSPANISLTQARAWLQNALNVLYCGADPIQTATMLRKVEEHLNLLTRASGTPYVDLSLFSPYVRSVTSVHQHDRYQTQPDTNNLFAVHGVLPYPLNLPFGLFIVADGMGEPERSQVASSIVIRQIVDAVLPPLMAGETQHLQDLLLGGIQDAHKIIRRYNQQGEGMTMGSLVTASLIVGKTATIVNVGDSRVYQYRPGSGLRQITLDHSIVSLMVSMKLINAEDIYAHPLRHRVYRALGTLETLEVDVDLFTIPLEDNDKLLLCSRGLWQMIRDSEIEHLMQRPVEGPENRANMFYKTATRGGGRDDIGVVVVDYNVPVAEERVG